MPMDRRPPGVKRAEMEQARTVRQINTMALVRDLHDNGFSSVWLESMQITDDGHFYMRVVLDDADIDHERMTMMAQVAEVHDAKIGLHEFSMNGHRFSRVTLWPSSEKD